MFRSNIKANKKQQQQMLVCRFYRIEKVHTLLIKYQYIIKLK